MKPVEKTIAELISAADHLLLVAHVAPDGDTVGSTLGLGWALRKIGKRCTLACPDSTPATFAFLPGSQELKPSHLTNETLVITIDGSDPSRFSPMFEEAIARHLTVVNIDHHATNTFFGQVNWVDTGAAAVAEMVLRLLAELEIPVDERIATCILTGLVTDTRGFRTTSTSARVLKVAAALMEAGAPLVEIMDQVYNHRPLSQVRLWGQVISQAQIEDSIIWSEITQTMLRECEASADSGGGLVSFLLSANEARVSIIFTEQADGRIDVSMRARRGVDLTAPAVRLGGGGHPLAAGCLRPGPITQVREQVLSEVRRSLDGGLPAL